MRRFVSIASCVVVTILALAPAPGSASDRQPPRGHRLVNDGARPLDPVAYAKAKAEAEEKAASIHASGSAPLDVQLPVVGASWEGQFSVSIGESPPDPTGAVGPTRYVELTNPRVGIYNRDGSLVAADDVDALTGLDLYETTDPQIIWDPTTQRFYYLFADLVHNTLAWGFSKTDSPSGFRGEWCRYTADFGYGSLFPDYPKLGDTADFLLVGVNMYRTPSFKYDGADVDWITKPPAGPLSTCPAQNSFRIGKFRRLTNADGTPTFTPVPADEPDTLSTGYVVAAADATHKYADSLTLFKVTKDAATGEARISAAAGLSVPRFSVPANAPQPGTTKTLETLDGRLEHAVAAVDPRLGHAGLWTAHAVFGGAGSEERWYEIDPTGATPALFQSGVATSPTLHVWNGAISPDRAVGPGGSGFGSNMVMGFDTSSSRQFSAIQMVSKIGTGPQSPFVLVQQSPGKNLDFSCSGSYSNSGCRWGDYSGASPDPAAVLTGDTGRVWLSNEWNVADVNGDAIDWRTWNWAATP
jgi:hypothetical protein